MSDFIADTAVAGQTVPMRKGLATLCVACALAMGCQKADVRKGQRPTDRELKERYDAWASQQPRPPRQVVDRIEALLAKEPCIGALNQWSRTYAYDEDMNTNILYPGIIAFDLKAAGKFGIEPGLHLTEPNSWFGIDDTPIKMAWGNYEVVSDKLAIGFCGNNLGPTRGPAIRWSGYNDDLERRRTLQNGRRVSAPFPAHD